MKVTLATVAVVVLMAPVLLVGAVALGPVAVGVLCAVGFGLIVFTLVNLAAGVGLLVERIGSRAMRHPH